MLNDSYYLNELGIVIVFLGLFIPAELGVVHGIYHYVNSEFHKWCFWCWCERLINKI